MKMKELILASSFTILLTGLFSYFIYQENRNANKVIPVMKETQKVISYIQNTNEFKEEYKSMYEQITFHEEENFFHEINCLLHLNYTPIEINELYDFVSHKNIEKLLDFEKMNLKNYYTIPNFEVDKIPRYEMYQDKTNTTLEEAVLKVNIGLDHEFYTQIEEIAKKDDYAILVNKYRFLGQYEPTDLKSLSYDEKYQLRQKAADAFEELVSFAKLENVFIRPYSAYRSYFYQQSIYNTYVNKDGKNMADTYSARPGHSEHQTGLAVDVWSEGLEELKESDANWLKENAYLFGFIVRYTKETEKITGYIEEPWHLRYLGKDLAKKVYESHLTYDEYYDLYLKNLN